VEDDLVVIDHSGREWKIAADLPLRTALGVVQLQQSAQSGEMDAPTFEAIVDGMWAILRRAQPDCTRDEVLEAFSITELMQLLTFVNFQMRQPRGAGTAGNGATPPQPEPAPTTAPGAATPRPRASRSKSAQES
jgi:hypothetical protein